MSKDIIELINDRISLRVYENTPIPEDVVNKIIDASLKSPTAGNLMLYSILKIKNPETKQKLSVSCDHQNFIATADTVLIYLADFQKMYDYLLKIANIEEYVQGKNETLTTPNMAMFYLAASDAIIASQTAVLAAEHYNVGTCYIGDIVENIEEIQDLLHLERWTIPVAMLTLGNYPEGYNRRHRDKFDKKYMVFEEEYRTLNNEELMDMFSHREKLINPSSPHKNYGEFIYNRKLNTDFMNEMERSFSKYVEEWNRK